MSGKRRNEARRWFQQSLHDLDALRWSIQGGFYELACFLAQQAGGKALKALLYYLGAKRRALLTHSLWEMVREASRIVPEFTDLAKPARELDLHYIPSRYPNGLPDGYPHIFYDREMAEEARMASEKIVNAVRKFFLNQGEEEIVQTPVSQ